MALEAPLVKSEDAITYAELTCGTENISPYSATSGYPDHVNYYQTDYDWHHQNQSYHHDPHQTHIHQQQQSQPPHSLHSVQLTDLSSRQYYTTPYPESHDVTTSVSPTYSGFTHHHSIPQSEFYNSPLWSSPQPTEYIAAPSLINQPRLFSGIDMSQQVVPSGGPPSLMQTQQTPINNNGKPKRKRVQSHSQRKAANVRERRRMFHLNEAFDLLRKRLPAFSYEKRLSRIETLRLAMTYISFMKDVTVGGDPKSVKLKPHGLDLGGSDMINDIVGHEGSSPNMDENHAIYNFSINDCSDSNSDDSVSLQNLSH